MMQDRSISIDPDISIDPSLRGIEKHTVRGRRGSFRGSGKRLEAPQSESAIALLWGSWLKDCHQQWVMNSNDLCQVWKLQLSSGHSWCSYLMNIAKYCRIHDIVKILLDIIWVVFTCKFTLCWGMYYSIIEKYAYVRASNTFSQGCPPI